jgi:hypothetical protein
VTCRIKIIKDLVVRIRRLLSMTVKTALASKQTSAGSMEPVRNAPQCLQCSRPNTDPEFCRSRGSRSRSRNGDNWDLPAISGGVANCQLTPGTDIHGFDVE